MEQVRTTEQSMKQASLIRLGFLLALCSGAHYALAQGTAFTYQGILRDKNTGAPAAGAHTLTFSVWPTDTGSIASWQDPAPRQRAVLSDGLVSEIVDAGAGIFTGDRRWLQIDVDGVPQLPRLELTPTPYAIFAERVANLRLDQVSTSGLDPEFSVNSVGGYKINQVANGAIGATIAGGGYSDTHLNGDHPNTISANFGSIGGGSGNYVAGAYGVVPGGVGNYAFGFASFAAGQSAQAFDDNTFVWGDGSQPASSSGPNKFEILARGGMTLTSPRGIALDAFDGPIITRGWDRFAIANSGDRKYQLGRWGLFMESATMGLGMPDTDVGERSLGFWKYSPNGTYTTLFSVRNTDGLASLAGGLNCGGPGYFAGDVNSCTLSIRGGCDLAEPFQMSGQEISRGAVVVIDEEHPGQLRMSDRAYDTRVAGIVSGANGINTGIALRQEGKLDGGQNVALSGRVYVLADTSNGPIKPGDLLTTSAAPGRAMRVTDHARAQGAILGKAMGALNADQGLVLVLVTLE
jgi:hypothetical protein